MRNTKKLAVLACTCFLATAMAWGNAADKLLHEYHRLLPLEGGSNFRDMGGYQTHDGKTVVRGELFRSGTMTSLTPSDQNYLEQFNFQKVVDLRSRDELELSPNHWVKTANIQYRFHDYEFESLSGKSGFSLKQLYQDSPRTLKPHLTLFFNELLSGNTPLVVNCSAGQDRTGIASALLLSALGVPRHTVIEDYLLSTDYRNGENEFSAMNLDAAPNNKFAQMVLRMKGRTGAGAMKPKILKTAEGTPYISYFFESIDADYGNLATYLDRELGVGEKDLQRLKELYLFDAN